MAKNELYLTIQQGVKSDSLLSNTESSDTSLLNSCEKVVLQLLESKRNAYDPGSMVMKSFLVIQYGLHNQRNIWDILDQHFGQCSLPTNTKLGNIFWKNECLKPKSADAFLEAHQHLITVTHFMLVILICDPNFLNSLLKFSWLPGTKIYGWVDRKSYN